MEVARAVNHNKAKGTRWESACTDYLIDRGFTNTERRALHGANDRGDIAGIPGVVIECKNEERYTLAEWVNELEAELDNDPFGGIGAVFAKRRGRDTANGYAILPIYLFVDMLRELHDLRAAETNRQRHAGALQ